VAEPYGEILTLWNELCEYTKSFEFLNKGEVINCYKLLIKLYSKIYSLKVYLGSVIRAYELTRLDFEKNSREYVMKGFAADEREKLRNISMPEKIKEDYDKLASLVEFVDGAKKIEKVLDSLWQNFILDFKLSGMSH